jgi:two-component system, OmpR family, sensor kinase
MFGSLRGRLLLSYLAIICVCLALVTVTMVLLARPIQERLLRTRLAARAALVAPRLQSGLDEGLSPAQLGRALSNRLDRQTARALLLDADGTILGDNGDAWTGRRLAGLMPQLEGQTRTSGSTAAPDGANWSYAAAAIGRDVPGGPLWLVLLAPVPGPVLGLFVELREGILAAVGIALACSVLLAALVSRSVARPLHQMAQAAEAIAAGDFDQPLDIRKPQEVRTLAESLQTMAQQVKTSQQATRDLVVNISHDLRTPLTSVQGFAQALMEGANRDEAARQHAAAVIYEEAGRMVRMVEQLGDIARMDAGQFKLEHRPVELAGLIGRVTQAVSPMFAAKGVSLVTDVPALPLLLADADRLTQVFTNLLDNALKFTPQNGRVQIMAQLTSGGPVSARSVRPGGLRHSAADATVPRGQQTAWVAVTVSDTGCGIPAEDLSRIFERFYRVDKARAARQGYGLGLAIAREVVEAHGGQIRAENLEGMGSRFTVLLPVDTARA